MNTDFELSMARRSKRKLMAMLWLRRLRGRWERSEGITGLENQNLQSVY
jgi:hypothetical protein